jgi:hypothetical protein
VVVGIDAGTVVALIDENAVDAGHEAATLV